MGEAKPLSAAKMGRIKNILRERIGALFDVQVMSAKAVEEKGWADPPCRMIVGAWGDFTFSVCPSGHVDTPRAYFSVAIAGRSSHQIAFDIIRGVRDSVTEGEEGAITFAAVECEGVSSE